jgi:glutamate synthase (NADPH/NADH) small chain
MEFLPLQNRRCEGTTSGRGPSPRDKRVMILGGNDAGADCLGTVHRQGARSVHQMEILPRPPDQRAPDNPAPVPERLSGVLGPRGGGERVYAVSTKRFLGDERGRVVGLEPCASRSPARAGGRSSARSRLGAHHAVQLVLLAMPDFLGPGAGDARSSASGSPSAQRVA